MKVFYLTLGCFIISIIGYSQVGINTDTPQQMFHIDGANNNPSTGAPNEAQQIDDFVVTENAEVGIGTSEPTQKLDVNGKLRVRDTEYLPTSSPTYPLYVDEDGVVGKSVIVPTTKIGYFERSIGQTLSHTSFNNSVEITIPISLSHATINTIGFTGSGNHIIIPEDGFYSVSASANLELTTGNVGNKVYIAFQVQRSSNNGSTWTTLTGARPIFEMHSTAWLYYPYTLPTIIAELNQGDRIRFIFYRTKSSSGAGQGALLTHLGISSGQGTKGYTLTLNKL